MSSSMEKINKVGTSMYNEGIYKAMNAHILLYSVQSQCACSIHRSASQARKKINHFAMSNKSAQA